MNLLVVGNDDSLAEFRLKFGSTHVISFKYCTDLSEEDLVSCEAIFDFVISPDHPHGHIYNGRPDITLLVNSVMTTVAELVKTFNWSDPVIGFNGLPGMFNRTILELAVDQTELSLVSLLCQQLHSEYKLVKDCVGMVTPRVLTMIINEACYTVEEGTANKEDVDLAMKLGTNYPAGPFEMLESIGVTNVYTLLNALHQTTGEDRYRIAPLLSNLYHQKS